MLQTINTGVLYAFVALFAALPNRVAGAASDLVLFGTSSDASGKSIMMFALFAIIGAVLCRIWMGIINHSETHEMPLSAIEKRKRKPYLPSVHAIIVTVACTAGLFLLSLKTVGGIAPFAGPSGTTYAAVFFTVIGITGIAAQFLWPRTKHYVFAFTVGTVVTFILLGFYAMIFDPGKPQDPFFMALGFLCVLLAWRFLFGPWHPKVKASVLATFVFWVGLHMIVLESPTERSARLLATLIAFIPALTWCLMFLKEHRQRLSLVVLMFLSGMISTAPILFYDALVRNNVELQFFLFRIVPESFTRSTNAFVTGNLVSVTGIRSTIIATLISFLIVGFIEEVSKFWVLKKSGTAFFSSIDDVLQLGIIVAIGFAFAENVMNPSYFLAFVREYLLRPDTPQWGAFMGNVLGRAILTNMVHVLSTGVFAYFYGLVLFAGPVLEDEQQNGTIRLIPAMMLRALQIPEKNTYRLENILLGLVSAVLLHGLFNFLVTLPDLLPNNPRTIGDLFGAGAGSPLHYIALLIIPSLFYIVGGFWILSVLFYKKENMKERGMLRERDEFVPADTLQISPAL